MLSKNSIFLYPIFFVALMTLYKSSLADFPISGIASPFANYTVIKTDQSITFYQDISFDYTQQCYPNSFILVLNNPENELKTNDVDSNLLESKVNFSEVRLAFKSEKQHPDYQMPQTQPVSDNQVINMPLDYETQLLLTDIAMLVFPAEKNQFAEKNIDLTQLFNTREQFFGTSIPAPVKDVKLPMPTTLWSFLTGFCVYLGVQRRNRKL